MQASHPIKADIFLLLVTVIAASGWIFTKEALAGFPPLLFMGLRFALAALVVAAFSPIPFYRLVKQSPNKQIIHSLLVGAVFSVAMAVWILGMFYGDHIGEGAFITSLGVVMVPWIGWICFGHKVSWQQQLAMLIAAAGLSFLFIQSDFEFKTGQWFFFAAAILLSIYFNINASVSMTTNTFLLTAIQLFVVGLVCLVLAFFTESWPESTTLSHWLWLLLSALIATSLRFFMQTEAQGVAPANHAALIMTLEPMWAALFAALWFSETMTQLQILGCGLIFAALIVGRWKRSKSLKIA